MPVTADTSQRGRVTAVSTADLRLLFGTRLFSIFCGRSIDQVYQISLHNLHKRVFRCPQFTKVVPVSAMAKRPIAPDRLRTRYCVKARRNCNGGSVLCWTMFTDIRSERSARNVLFSSLICFEIQLDIFFRTLGSIWRVPYYTGAVAATWRPASCILADRISAVRLASIKLLSCLLRSRQQLQFRAFGCSKGDAPL